jgi:ABC-type transport system involved in multi-copper enzyme maturation permease subunit
MIDALRFEWTRIRTIRSTYWLFGLGVLVTAVIAGILAYVFRNDERDALMESAVLLGGGEFATFIPVFVAIMGIFATGHEYRYGTIQPTLTTLPQRSALLAAKITVVVAVAIALVVVSLAINFGLAAIFWGSDLPDLASSPLNEVIPGYFVFIALNAILGVSLGQLFRGVPTAIVVLLVTPLIVEGLITGLSNVPALDWLVPVVKFLPFTAGARLIATTPPEEAFGPGSAQYEIFDRWVAGGIFAAFVAIILAVAWILFQKRDA